MIRFENVTKSLGGRKVLDCLSLNIRQGETFVIVGGSGAGKSVTIKHMVGLLTPDEGRVWVGDDCMSELRGRDLARVRARFGMLFQGAALLAWLNVEDNVALPLRERSRLDEGEVLQRVNVCLEMVGLRGTNRIMPAELSGGMRKRVGLARAMVMRPEIVLYDEPTSGLDPVTARSIDTLIDTMRAEHGMTNVVVTHDLHSALGIGTRIGMLFNGALVEVATPEGLMRSQVPQVRQFLAAQYIDDTFKTGKALPSQKEPSV